MHFILSARECEVDSIPEGCRFPHECAVSLRIDDLHFPRQWFTRIRQCRTGSATDGKSGLSARRCFTGGGARGGHTARRIRR